MVFEGWFWSNEYINETGKKHNSESDEYLDEKSNVADDNQNDDVTDKLHDDLILHDSEAESSVEFMKEHGVGIDPIGESKNNENNSSKEKHE